MNCKEYEELLIFYLDKSINSDKKHEFEQHITDCAKCAERMKDYTKTVDVLSLLPKKKLDESLKKELLMNMNKEYLAKQQYKPLFRTAKILIPAGIAAMLIVGVLLKYNIPIQIEKNSQMPLKINKSLEKPTQEETKNPENDQIIEETEIIYLAKASSNDESDSQVVYRGIPKNYVSKRIVKQWQDIHSGYKKEGIYCIETQNQWEKFWRIHASNIRPRPHFPEVDFSNSLVIAKFMGEKKSTGYGVRITRVDESENNLYVTFEETLPGLNSKIIKMPTQPYHVVVINKE